MKKNIDPREKYYVQNKYKISFDGINADIQISKAMERFIIEKLSENENNIEDGIESFKAFVPYVDLEYIIRKLNLKKSKKVFVISSDEVFKRNSDIEKLTVFIFFNIWNTLKAFIYSVLRKKCPFLS